MNIVRLAGLTLTLSGKPETVASPISCASASQAAESATGLASFSFGVRTSGGPVKVHNRFSGRSDPSLSPEV